MTDALTAHPTVCGQLNAGELRRLTGATRSGTIGPTTTYYAGVTAPVISAGMALLGAESFRRLGLDAVWLTLVSALFAGLAGIVWYLIFMRWSYRHKPGRASETGTVTLRLDVRGLQVDRGAIIQTLGWSALRQVKEAPKYVLVSFEGADPLLIPDRWFGQDRAACAAFRAQLKAKDPAR